MTGFGNYTAFKYTYGQLPLVVPGKYLTLPPYCSTAALYSLAGVFLGSGFYLEKGYLVTAIHVIQGESSAVEARFLLSSSTVRLDKRKVIGKDTVAFITGRIPDRVGLTPGSPVLGQEIMALGFEVAYAGRELSGATGTIKKMAAGMIAHDAAITDHQSGGPLVDRKHPQIVLGLNLGQLNELNRNFGEILNSEHL